MDWQHSTLLWGMKLSEWNSKSISWRSYYADVKRAFALMAQYLMCNSNKMQECSKSFIAAIALFVTESDDSIYLSVPAVVVIGLSGYNSFHVEWFQKKGQGFSEEGAPWFILSCQQTSIFWAAKWIPTCSRSDYVVGERWNDSVCVSTLHCITLKK